MRFTKDPYSSVSGFWRYLEGEEYALCDIYELSKEEIETIRTASERVGKIFFKTASIIRNLPRPYVFDLLSQMGFPEETFTFLLVKSMSPESVIARFDWALTKEGPKLLEINSDTPTFIKELFDVNGKVCQIGGVTNPNVHLEEQLKHAIQRAVKETSGFLGLEKKPYVVFTSHEDHTEDFYTVEYLRHLSELEGCRYVPLHKLKIDENGLYDEDERKIDILYRQTYPIEHLVLDEDPSSGTKIGTLFLQLVEERKLGIINPPSAFLLQSKALQSLIWGMAEAENGFFTSEEINWIEKYFLPTYLEADPFLEANIDYVKKPSFGREGDTVQIISPRNGVLVQNENRNYETSLPVFQKFAQLPVAPIFTERGVREAHLLIGCFLISGEASAVGIRAGEKITGNTSYFLPCGIKK